MRDIHRHRIRKEVKGARQWGKQRGIYTWQVENALSRELENDAALVYEKLVGFKETNLLERKIWAQFLLSQEVRTPAFMRYERAVQNLSEDGHLPQHDRVGCLECLDLQCITSRDWCFLLAHPEDYFVRSDNPLLLSGFIDRAETCAFYPLSPRVCFVACSMPQEWLPIHPPKDQLPASFGYQLAKGGAWAINFHIARAADESLILHPGHDGELAESMFGEILGLYPQPPFSLHSGVTGPFSDAFESIRIIMSAVDGFDYPFWQPFELEPFYRQG